MCRYYTIGQYWHHAAANQEAVFDKDGSGTTQAAANMAAVLGSLPSGKLYPLISRLPAAAVPEVS